MELLHVLTALLLVLPKGVSGAFCRFQEDNLQVEYGVDRKTRTVHFTLRVVAAQPSFWTSVAFGDSMQSGLDVLMVRVMDGQVFVSDENVRGHRPSVQDARQDVQVQYTGFSNGMAEARFSRPLRSSDSTDAPLAGCTNWNFATGFNRLDAQGGVHMHSRRPTQKVVCLQQCRI